MLDHLHKMFSGWDSKARDDFFDTGQLSFTYTTDEYRMEFQPKRIKDAAGDAIEISVDVFSTDTSELTQEERKKKMDTLSQDVIGALYKTRVRCVLSGRTKAFHACI